MAQKKKIPHKANPAKPVTAEKTKTLSRLRQHRLFIILLGLLLYGWTINFDFALDDTLMITGNKFTQKGIDGIGEIFTTDAFEGFFGGKGQVAGGRYRPFTQFIFAIEVELFGFTPIVGHLFNIVIYILLLLTLFSFLRRLFPDRPDANPFLTVPLVITALFAAHPLHTEAVANIKGCDEILSMLCCLGTMILLFDYIKKPALWRLIVSFFLFFIALLTKESAITWLAVLPCILYFFTSAKSKEYIITLSTIIIPSAIFIFIRSRIVGGLLETNIAPELLNNPFLGTAKVDEIATVVYTWLIYFKLLLFPHPLTHDYYPKQIAITDFGDPMVLLSLALVIASIVVIIRGLKNKSVISFALIFYWATFSISSNLLFNIGTFMNERFMFTPLLAFAIIAGYYFGKKVHKAPWLKAAFFVILGVYSVKTISRSLVWENNETLFLTDVKTSTNSAKVNVSAAEVLLRKADKETLKPKQQALANEALQYLNRAEKIHPAYYGVYDLRGWAYFFLDRYDLSLQDYIHCTKIDATKKEASDNVFRVGMASLQKNDSTTALAAFRYLTTFQPDSASHCLRIAEVYDKFNLHDKSFFWVQKALAVDSAYAPAWNKGGEMYGRVKNDLVTSEKYLLKSYSLDPLNSSTLQNLGALYGFLNKPSLAEKFLLKSDSVKPNDVNILNNLGSLYRTTLRFDVSERYFQKSLSIDPRNINTLQNIAVLYNQMKRPDMAIKYLRKVLDLTPKNPAIASDLGRLYQSIGRSDSASYFMQMAGSGK